MAQELTPSSYISHHMTNLNQTGHAQGAIVDFTYINIDTIVMSVVLGFFGLWILYRAAKRAHSGVPGRFQMAIEMLVELVEGQSKALVHGDRRFIAPMALTIFVWITLMNAMDLIPLDLPTVLVGAMNIDLPYLRIVPTADINGTLGIALGVLMLMLYYSVKIKGVVGFAKELAGVPFAANSIAGKIILFIPNVLMNLVEFVSKTLSLGMRLFGNMFAGEIVFSLIALLGATATWYGFLLHWVSGTAWALFHILIILLQAYIFMTLTLVYMGQSHDHH